MASPKRARQRQRRLIQEAAATVTEVRTDLLDLSEAAIRPDGTANIKIISPGWGTSGYYSPDVLEAAGTDRVFPRGTQMFLDHPGSTERHDRPERSVRDLAAVLETDGVWQANHPDGPGLYAQAKVFETYQPLIKDLAPYIGVSIRAAAEMGTGEAEGRKGRIVERLVEAVSVDFVTKAGRGGAVISVLEAAGRTDLIEEQGNVGEWFQSRIHLDFTTRADDMFGDGRLTKEERIALSTGIGAALDAFSTTVEDLAPQLLSRSLWADPAAATQTTESQEDAMTPEEIKEAVAAAMKAEVTPIQTELTETKTKLEATEVELAEAKAAGTAAAAQMLATEATAHVAAHAKVKALPAPAAAKVTAALVEKATAGTDGNLDVAKLDAAITEAVDAEVKYLAEAAGSVVRGVGGGETATTEEADKAVTDRLEEGFKRIGVSDEAAKIAVGGRAR